VVPILLFGAGCFLLVGAYAMYSQQKSRWVVGLFALLGVMCVVAGGLYL
jgi:predicted ferric reductase